MTEEARERSRAAGRVGTRPATWLAWLLWTAIMVFGATLLEPHDARWYLFVLSEYFWRYPEIYSDVLESSILVLSVPAYATVGAVVASLRPRNGVGWLCLALSLVLILVNWQPTDLALMGLANLLSGLAWILTVPPLAVTLMLLIFPDGRLPSRRWWAVVVMALAHPILAPLMEPFRAHLVATSVQTIGFSVSLAALLASMVAIFLRWRRSRDQERQQIKLLVYALTVTVAAVLAAVASWYVSADFPGAESYLTALAGVVVMAGIALGIPLAMGVAILKHRLYDVDVVINRTLVYAALTVSLALVYIGGVALMQGIGSVILQVPVRALTGQETQFATVVATLAMAALFTPLRRWIQSFIDRRFYRGKYDAAKTLEAFSAKLRDETDLDALNSELVEVVGKTMQPSHVSLWLRPDLDDETWRLG